MVPLGRDVANYLLFNDRKSGIFMALVLQLAVLCSAPFCFIVMVALMRHYPVKKILISQLDMLKTELTLLVLKVNRSYNTLLTVLTKLPKKNLFLLVQF